MKPNQIAVFFFLATLFTGISFSSNAQRTVIPITSSFSSSAYPSGTICSNCELVLSPGVTITINSTCSCSNCTFVGGNVTIASGSNFTLSGVDSFTKETVLINSAMTLPSSGVMFYGDTVAFNASMSLANGRTFLDSSRVSVNAALSLDDASFDKDSLHLNSNLTVKYGVDSFNYSNIDVASGVTISSPQTNVVNSTFAFAGSSSMTAAYGLNSSNSNYYLAGTSSLNSSNATTMSGDNMVLSGTTANFITGNGLTTTNSNLTLSGTGNKLTAQSLTTTGGTITGATGSTISSTNAISLTNTTVNLTGTTFGGSQLTTSGGSFTSTGTTVNSTYAVSFTNTPVSLTNGSISGSQLTTSGSTFSLASANGTFTYADQFSSTAVSLSGTTQLTGSQATVSSGSLTMANTSGLTVTYAYSSTGSTTDMKDNSTLSAGSLSESSHSYMKIGSGTLPSTAHVNLSGTFSVDNTSNLIVADNNNYLNSTTSSFSTNTFSCGGASPQHACQTNYVYGCTTITNNVGLTCTPLAVASITLKASATTPGQVALAWTDNSIDPAGQYEIQRATTADQWTTIATIDVNTNQKETYQYTDNQAPSGTVNYRIERVDPNGNADYSSVSSVTTTASESSIGIFPNPAVGGRFYLTTPGTDATIVNIYTSAGQLLLHAVLQGQTQYPIQLSQPLSLSALVVHTVYQNTTHSFTVLVR